MDPHPPRPVVTLRYLAQTLGVSHSTVSRALRNNPKIPEAHRIEIQAAAEKMGYRANPMATALAHLRQNSMVKPAQAALAWLNAWPDPKMLRSHVEFDRYWQGATAAAEKFGYRLEEFSVGRNLPLRRLRDILNARGINGILLPPQHIVPNAVPIPLGEFPWAEFSIVRFGRSIRAVKAHAVASDQVANAMMAFEQMRARGYERIGFVTGYGPSWGVIFEAGYLMAQQTVEKRDRLQLLTLDESDPANRRRQLARWLKHENPDAVLTDVAALPDLLKKCGCRVPEDLGLAGTSVPDTGCDAGIDQNSREIGRVAVLVLISLTHDHDRGIPPLHREILVKGHWIDGSSLPRRAA